MAEVTVARRPPQLMRTAELDLATAHVALAAASTKRCGGGLGTGTIVEPV